MKIGSKEVKIGFSQWNTETPKVIDNIYHLYLFLWSVWILIMGCKFITIPDHASIVATYISSLMVPVIYSFCRCFGIAVPDDIAQAEAKAAPLFDPKLQALIDRLDKLNNMQFTIPTTLPAKAALNIADADHYISPSAQIAYEWIQKLNACKSLDEVADIVAAVPDAIIKLPGFQDCIKMMQGQLSKIPPIVNSPATLNQLIADAKDLDTLTALLPKIQIPGIPQSIVDLYNSKKADLEKLAGL